MIFARVASFAPPRQTVLLNGIEAKADAILILIHEDFIRNTAIQSTLENASYFSCAIHEALHLSPKEEVVVRQVFDTLMMEYQQHHDAFSKDIMVPPLNTLLTYAERFYRRQIQQRMETGETTLRERFLSQLKSISNDHIPSVEYVAKPRQSMQTQRRHH